MVNAADLMELSVMGNLVNGDISTAEVLENRRLEISGGAHALKYKRRKVSANREFPQGCGPYASQNSEKLSEGNVDVGPLENSGIKTDVPVELDCVKPLGGLVEPVTLDVDTSSIIESPQSPKALISETTELLESLDKQEALEHVKTIENPEVLDESEMVNPPTILEPESSDLSKTELHVSKNLDEPVPTGLLENASKPTEKELLAAQSTIDMVLSDLPGELKFSETQTSPAVDAVGGSLHKNYPRRRISACRDFPRGCGRNAPPLSPEECQKLVVSSRERSLISKKEQIIGGDTKKIREEVQDGDALKSKHKDIITKEYRDEVGVKSEREVKKEMVERNYGRVASESRLKREDKTENSNRPPRESNMSRSDLKSTSSGKKVDREVGAYGGKSVKEYVKLHAGVSLKRKISGKSAEEFRAISQSKVKENVGLGSFDNRVVVQGLMAASNCPWRQGKRSFKSPSSLTHSTARSKAKKQEPMPLDNTKSISKKNKDAESSEGKSTKKKMSLSRGLAHEAGGQLVLKDEGAFSGNDDKDDSRILVEKSQGSALNLIPFGLYSSADKDDDGQSVVTRKKVRETLRLFQVVYRKYMQEEEAKSKEGQVSKRFDLLAGNLLKDRHKWVNTGKPIVGPVPGVEVGDEFHYRVELAIIGLHRPFQSGIDFVSGGKNLATSIVASGGYADEMDSSDILKYSGQGGNPTGPGKKAEDQKLVRGNLSLKNSMDQRSPVRVIRGFKERGSDSLDTRGKVTTTYTYDGLYLVEHYWQEKGRHGNNVFMFQLRRIPGQPELALKEVKKSEKTKVREGLCVADISQGKEKMKICAVNTIDNEKPPPFQYITNIIYPSWYERIPPRGCECTDGCSDSEKCLCAVKNGGEIPFNYDGAIVEAKHLVYECGPSCKCPPSCHNRVSQHGIKFPLEIFKTQSRGWGVRSRASIPSGSFICEYTGELLQDKEAEERTGNDEYLFDIGNNFSDPFWEGLSTVMQSDLKTSSSVAKVEDVGFTIDAAQFGSVGRFVNHSCSPNLYAQNVLYDHDDKRMPHIMLFAAENIPPLQELTYHYNYQIDQVHDSDGKIKKKDCYCGAAECTGRMY